MNGVAKSYLQMLAENPSIRDAELRKAVNEWRALTNTKDMERG